MAVAVTCGWSRPSCPYFWLRTPSAAVVKNCNY